MDSSFPKISVLLAARNEEHTIVRCLKALVNLDFPKDRIEILVGNDASTDATGSLIDQFIVQNNARAFIQSIPIVPLANGLRGKTNVLAQLARVATGDYFFFCDADIAVAPSWIHGMMRHFSDGVGSVIGLTRMTPTGLFADLQSLEWLTALTGMYHMSRFKLPSTGMGNNMAVSRKAYEAVGGYETVGFSIVEDYALYRAILNAGYEFRNAYEPSVLSISEPVTRLSDLIIQRKRWVKGAMQSALFLRIQFILTALLLPFLLFLGIVNTPLAATIGGFHYTLLTLCASVPLIRLRQNNLWKALPLFWFYFTINTTLMLVNHFLPYRTIWKGRVYE